MGAEDVFLRIQILLLPEPLLLEIADLFEALRAPFRKSEFSSM